MPRGVHPNSLANLKRGKRFGNTEDSSTIDAKECSKKGIKARKEKKTLAECMSLILDASVKNEELKDEMSEILDIEDDDKTYGMALMIAMFQRGMKGDVSAAKFAAELANSKGDAEKKLDHVREIMKRLDAESGAPNAQ